MHPRERLALRGPERLPIPLGSTRVCGTWKPETEGLVCATGLWIVRLSSRVISAANTTGYWRRKLWGPVLKQSNTYWGTIPIPSPLMHPQNPTTSNRTPARFLQESPHPRISCARTLSLSLLESMEIISKT